MIRNASTTSILLIQALILALATLGCAGAGSITPEPTLSGIPSGTSQPGARFESMEGAAVAALAHIRATATRSEVEQLHIGSIVQIDGGYTWTEPQRSGSHANQSWRPRVRLAPGSDHVATYVVHPRTGDTRIDRMNEKFTRGERRIVDEADPLHRPLFLLTPSGRIVSYHHDAPSIEVADLNRRRAARATENVASGSHVVPSAETSPIGLAGIGN